MASRIYNLASGRRSRTTQLAENAKHLPDSRPQLALRRDSLGLARLARATPVAPYQVGILQRIVGNHIVGNLLRPQMRLPVNRRTSLLQRQIAEPKDAPNYEAWLQSFPNYQGPGDIALTADASPDLQALIRGEPRLPPDCADISLLLRHYYLKSKGDNFTIRTGPKSKAFTIGKGISDKQVKQHMINLGSINFQEERKRFAMINFYRSGKNKTTNLKALIAAGLKAGDVLVWKRLAGIQGNFQGHVQTVQSIDVKNKTVIVVQGNMEAGKGVGALQQRHYSFQDLTGDPDGDAQIMDAPEESFFGAGPWR